MCKLAKQYKIYVTAAFHSHIMFVSFSSRSASFAYSVRDVILLTSFQMQIRNIMTESFHHNNWHFIWLCHHWGLAILFPHSEFLSRIMSELMCSAVLILQCILHSGLWLIVFRAGRVRVDQNLWAGSPKERASMCFCSILPLSDEDTLWITMCDI